MPYRQPSDLLAADAKESPETTALKFFTYMATRRVLEKYQFGGGNFYFSAKPQEEDDSAGVRALQVTAGWLAGLGQNPTMHVLAGRLALTLYRRLCEVSKTCEPTYIPLTNGTFLSAQKFLASIEPTIELNKLKVRYYKLLDEEELIRLQTEGEEKKMAPLVGVKPSDLIPPQSGRVCRYMDGPTLATWRLGYRQERICILKISNHDTLGHVEDLAEDEGPRWVLSPL